MSESEKRRIPVGKVLANDGNPRKDFGDIGKLAATFRANGGEPWSPIIVVPEPGGDWYRLADGERRWRAMQSIGTETCDALVFATMGEAEAAIAMMATDDSKALTEEERFRGFQTMMALGVSDEDAASVIGTDKATVRRVRRIAKGELPEQTTLDAAIAAADDEFDDEERQQILKAGAGARWKGQAALEADRIRKSHERAARLRAIRDALPEGVEYSTRDAPYDAARAGLVYLSTVHSADGAARFAKNHAGEDLVAFEKGIAYALYRRADVSDKEAEEARVRQYRDDHVDAYKDAYAAMCRWATEPWCSEDAAAQQVRRQTGTYRPCTRRLALCEAVGDWLFANNPWSRITGDSPAATLLGPAASVAEDDDMSLRDVCCYLIARHGNWGLLGWSGTDVFANCARSFAEVYDALVTDGWRPTEGAQALREMCVPEGGNGDGE